MDALGINLPGLVTQIVSFLLLFAALYFLLYKPLLRMMDGRSARIRESLEKAERAREEAARSEESMQRQIEEARAEGQTMIAASAGLSRASRICWCGRADSLPAKRRSRTSGCAR